MNTPVRNTDPATSHQAAHTQTPARKARVATAVTLALSLMGEATHEQLCAWIHTHHGHMFATESSIRTRCRELVRAGVVEAVGMGVTARGRTAIVWALKETNDD